MIDKLEKILKEKAGFYTKHGVAAFIIDEKDNVLLLLRNKKPDFNCWTIPGGKLEGGENFYSALKREVKEETNLSIEISNLLTITEPFDSHVNERWFSPVFLVNIKKGIPKNMEPDSHQQLKWFSLANVPENINTTTKLAIEAYMKIKF